MLIPDKRGVNLNQTQEEIWLNLQMTWKIWLMMMRQTLLVYPARIQMTYMCKKFLTGEESGKSNSQMNPLFNDSGDSDISDESDEDTEDVQSTTKAADNQDEDDDLKKE